MHAKIGTFLRALYISNPTYLNCLAYARVSTEKQAEKELSIPAQIRAMREYAARQGWVVLEEFTEPGASARTADRPVLKQLLARCRAQEPKIDVVLVHKVDRLARNVYDHATIRALLKQRGIRLASVVENMDDSITGQLVENIMASIADFYSANLGEEVKKGMRARIQRGEWPHRPAVGYQKVKGADSYSLVEPDPITAPLVRQAFELYATGRYSIPQLADELATKGLLSTLGKPLSTSYLELLLRNQFYVGRLPWKGHVYPAKHAALVTVGLFDEVQHQLRSKAQRSGIRNGSLQFWLRGIAYCADCGSKMTAERHRRWSYYRCLANTKGRQRCRAPFSNAERLHQRLQTVYKTFALSTGARRQILDAARTYIRSKHADLYKRRSSLVMFRTKLLERQARAADGFTSGDLSREAYLAQNSKIEQQVRGVDEQLRTLVGDQEQTFAGIEERVRSADSLWAFHVFLTEEERARLVSAVFSRLAVRAGDVIDFTIRPAFAGLLERPSRSDTSIKVTESAPDVHEKAIRALLGSCVIWF